MPKSERDGINPAVKPSGTGCVECLALGGWWFHLRRCAECGHIGCCDSSPNQHASKHNAATGHPIITSFEPGERWFYDYRTEEFFTGPKLPAPHSHPLDQPTPGPAGAGAFKLANAASRIGAALLRWGFAIIVQFKPNMTELKNLGRRTLRSHARRSAAQSGLPMEASSVLCPPPGS